MKLQTYRTVPCGTGAVQIDDYVPISFRACSSPVVGPHRICQKDGPGRLVEFGVARGIGEVVAFTLVMWRGAVGNCVPGEFAVGNAISGLPCVDTGAFSPVVERASQPETFERPLALYIGQSEALIVIEPNVVPTESFVVDRAVFFSRKQCICGVLVQGLNSEEQGILRSMGT